VRILVVEDEPVLREGLVDLLRGAGHSVEAVADGEAALGRGSDSTIQLLLLDLMLPKLDGIEVCRRLRAARPGMAILMLTSRGSENDKVLGLGEGADDYVTKPFAFEELLARVEALLRRTTLPGSDDDTTARDTLQIGTIEICPGSRSVRRNGKIVDLAPKEFDLLLELVRRDGAVVSRMELMKKVWGHSSVVVSRTVDTHIAELRRKLEKDSANPELIITVRKAGYRIGDNR